MTYTNFLEDNIKDNLKSKTVDVILFKKLIRNWIHQGITYMDTGEIIIRLSVELLEIIAFIIILYFAVGQFLSFVYILVICVIVVHTINWVINMNFWALLLFSIPDLRNRGKRHTCEYLNSLADRLKRSKSISGLAIFGSISRKQWHDKSDIDARILRQPGLINLFKSSIITMRERIIAFILRHPLDLYLADGVDFLQNMRKDEPPIFLIKRDARLEHHYPNNPERIFSITLL